MQIRVLVCALSCFCLFFTAALDGDDAQSIETMPSELLLKPFKLAVATGNAKLQEASLACLHKILAHGIFAEDTGVEVRSQ